MHFDNSLPGRIGNAVGIPADAYHAFMRDPPFQLQQRAEGRQRQQFEVRLLLGEGLVDVTLGGGVHTRIGNGIEPMSQLAVQVVEIAERAGEEEVLTDVAEGPLDLSLGFGPVCPAGLWLEAVVSGEVDERSVVDDAAAGLTDDRGLHAVVKDLIGDAADRVERRHMAAQDRLHVLVQDKPRPDQPAEAEHSTNENSQTMRVIAGSSVNCSWNWAKSTCAWSPGGVSKRTSKPGGRAGPRSRSTSVMAV